MDNFMFYSPTRFLFGKGEENQVGTMCAQYGAKKVMLVYGGGSVVRSGLLERVKSSLDKAGIPYCELSGIKPNPRLSSVYEGIQLGREQGVDFLLGVGGGSAIDAAKGIAVGILYEGDVWDLYKAGAEVPVSLPVGCVITLAATGTEGSASSVLTNEETNEKCGAKGDLLRPVFSIMNPELTCTLPAYQTACGVTDIMMHIIDRYFTNSKDTFVVDEISEALLRTVIKYGPIALEHPDDYNARAQIMWAGTLAHNNLCGVGREQDWSNHGIQAPIGGLYDSAHGAGLATVCPAWMLYVYKHDIPRFVRWATNVWGVENDVYDPEGVALEGIRRTKEFFKRMGMPVTLAELGVKDEDLEYLSKGRACGNFVKLNGDDIRAILELAR